MLAAIAAVTPGGADPSADPAPAPAPETKPLTARFATAAQFTRSDQGAAIVRIELDAPAVVPVVVPFTVSGTARAGRDFLIEPGRAVVPAGETGVDITVTALPASDDEDVETVVLSLGPIAGPPGGTIGTGGTLVPGLGSHTVAISPTSLGDPLGGLSADELAAFKRGRKLFEKRFTPEEGLGPFYNATSCVSCHSKPVTGGTAGLYRNFYLAVYQFGATPNSQSTSIPPFLSQVVPAFGSGEEHSTSDFTLEGGRPLIPETVLGFPVLVAQRNSIPIFGVGLFEHISNDTIAGNADPFDLDGDGISGRVNTALGGTAMGRFGVKSQSNNIELFTRAPLQNQMGITTNPFEGAGSIVSLPRAPFQVSGNPNDPTIDDDGVPDPEMSHDDLGDLIAFTRLLAPPVAKPFNADALAGQELFEQARCTDCHIPSLPSTKGEVRAYTDLLLHYMGPDLVDNMKFGEASVATTDFRTQPLWGVSHFSPYLHDGRATTLRDAIEMHDGEGLTSRNLFLALSTGEQAQLIAFLEHL